MIDRKNAQNLYSNLLKIIFGSLIIPIFIPSFVYLLCSLLIDKNVNITSLLLTIFCIVLYIILLGVINIINKVAKNKIVFQEEKIQYKNKTIYANSANIKYFKFYISIIEPSLVIPKVHINGNGLSITCYLSKKDIKTLKKMNFEIKEI